MIYDPNTTVSDGKGGYIRTPFANNIIPTDRLDPIAKTLSQFIPAPGSLTGSAAACGVEYLYHHAELIESQ